MSQKVAFNSNIRCIVAAIKDKLLCYQNQLAVFKPGVPSAPGYATALGDPSTLNAELQYKILTQAPNQPAENMFQMDSRTWALSVEDTSQVSNYHLIVQVKELGNRFLGYCALATVGTAIMENTQVAPGALFFPELLNISYPQIISKHEIQVLAGNSDRLLYSDPLTLLITVMDENDNLPVLTQEFYQVTLKENTAKRSEVITVEAENINDPKTNNSKIVYEIPSQEPQVPNGFSFHIGMEIQMISKRNWSDNLAGLQFAAIASAAPLSFGGSGALVSATICLCTKDRKCKEAAKRTEGKPTVISAVFSIIVGTVGTIGM
ncbi:LOW QUALITY PROTEIN: cadherin-16 [Pluvialis apricaria]